MNGHTNGAKILQIESDAKPLGPGRKDGGDPFPSHNHHTGDDRIFEEQAEGEKHGAIAETRESRHQEIRPQLAKARSIKNIRFSRRTKAGIGEVEASKDGHFEERDGHDRAGKKLSHHQDFSAYRDEKLIMEGAF